MKTTTTHWLNGRGHLWRGVEYETGYDDERACVTIGYNRRGHAWRVVFVGMDANDDYLCFGPAPYGGTKDEAIRDAVHVASKNGFYYLDPKEAKAAMRAVKL